MECDIEDVSLLRQTHEPAGPHPAQKGGGGTGRSGDNDATPLQPSGAVSAPARRRRFLLQFAFVVAALAAAGECALVASREANLRFFFTPARPAEDTPRRAVAVSLPVACGNTHCVASE